MSKVGFLLQGEEEEEEGEGEEGITTRAVRNTISQRRKSDSRRTRRRERQNGRYHDNTCRH